MTKPRRRQDGEGAIIEYKTRAGLRYAIKWREERQDGTERQVLRRKTRDGRPMTTRRLAADELREILSGLSRGDYVTPTEKLTVGAWFDDGTAPNMVNDDAIRFVARQGLDQGAAMFSRLEGTIYDRGWVYFTSTQGGFTDAPSHDDTIIGFGTGWGQIWGFDTVGHYTKFFVPTSM